MTRLFELAERTLFVLRLHRGHFNRFFTSRQFTTDSGNSQRTNCVLGHRLWVCENPCKGICVRVNFAWSMNYLNMPTQLASTLKNHGNLAERCHADGPRFCGDASCLRATTQSTCISGRRQRPTEERFFWLKSSKNHTQKKKTEPQEQPLVWNRRRSGAYECTKEVHRMITLTPHENVS